MVISPFVFKVAYNKGWLNLLNSPQSPLYDTSSGIQNKIKVIDLHEM